MKTIIKIKGQIHGNHRLYTHLHQNDEKSERFFQDFILTFRTKKEAKKALWMAYKNLKELEPDFYRDGGIRYLPGRKLLYDASRAEIIEK